MFAGQMIDEIGVTPRQQDVRAEPGLQARRRRIGAEPARRQQFRARHGDEMRTERAFNDRGEIAVPFRFHIGKRRARPAAQRVK